MSKSKGNVVSPEHAVQASGADALRLALLFKAPFEADIEWDNKGMDDLARFLSRVFRLVDAALPDYDPHWNDGINFEEAGESAKKIRRLTHQTIRNVTTDIERFALNTYISWLMKFVNELNPFVLRPRGAQSEATVRDRSEMLALSEAVDALVLMLAPGAPHTADELWEITGHIGFTYHATWPKFHAALAVEDSITIAVQVNGKLRDTFEVEVGTSREVLQLRALELPKVKGQIDGKTVNKVIVVPGKLVNIVAS
jgi:leucyl-tRNA synthetase